MANHDNESLTADEAAGMAWWNNLSETGRQFWLQRTSTAVVADAYARFKKEPLAQADAVAGRFETLRDRVVAAGYGNRYTDQEVAEMRFEMDGLSSQYLDLTGERLK